MLRSCESDYSGIDLNIFLLGAAQGVITSIVLLSKKRSSSLLVLSILIAALSIQLGLIGSYGYVLENFPGLITINWMLPFTFAPCVFLYLRDYLEGRKLSAGDLIHFSPFLASLIFCIPYWQLSPLEKQELQLLTDPYFFVTSLSFESVRLLQGLLYTLLSVKLLQKATLEAKTQLSHFNLKWSWVFLWTSVLAWALALASAIIFFLQWQIPNPYNLLYAFVVILIYALSWKLVGQPDLLLTTESKSQRRKYANTSLDEDTINNHLKVLIEVMTREQLFRNPDLRLKDVSDQLGIPTYQLSQVINTALNINFYDYVNNLRVEYVRENLKSSESAHLKILALAYDAGFNAKSTFNHIFKKHTGMTPSAFRAKYGPNS